MPAATSRSCAIEVMPVAPASGRRQPCQTGAWVPEQLLRADTLEEIDDERHQACPASLVARPQPPARVAVEVLVEENPVAPVRILVELHAGAVDRPAPVLV